jgi:hypothetical protein
MVAGEPHQGHSASVGVREIIRSPRDESGGIREIAVEFGVRNGAEQRIAQKMRAGN